MPTRFTQHVAAMLFFGTLNGCLGWLVPPAPPAPREFVVIKRDFNWPGSLAALTERARVGLARQGALLKSADTDRVKYELSMNEQPASLMLRRTPSGVSMKVVALGPYAGSLALRVSACTKALRKAAAQAAAPEPALAVEPAQPAQPAQPASAPSQTNSKLPKSLH